MWSALQRGRLLIRVDRESSGPSGRRAITYFTSALVGGSRGPVVRTGAQSLDHFTRTRSVAFAGWMAEQESARHSGPGPFPHPGAEDRPQS
jgi:hypothetical protein